MKKRVVIRVFVEVAAVNLLVRVWHSCHHGLLADLPSNTFGLGFHSYNLSHALAIMTGGLSCLIMMLRLITILRLGTSNVGCLIMMMVLIERLGSASV